MQKNLETRINAMIPYFFLGPLILFAKKGTPLADSYVQNHAKRATLVMLFGIVSFVVYLFLKPIINFSFFGLYGPTVVLGILMTIFFLILLVGMYQAYQGVEIENVFQWKNPKENLHLKEQDYSEEEKIRILASFIPFLGIFLTEKYPNPEMKIGLKMGNLFLILLFFTQIFVGGINSATFLVSILYITFFVGNAVSLFGFSSFFSHRVYDFIPTYHQIEAHIRTSFVYIFEFLKVAFGKNKKFSYAENYQKILAEISQIKTPQTLYWTDSRIIGLPFVNLLSLPSIGKEQFSLYKQAILEGLFLTLLFGVEIFFYGVSHPYFFLLLIPTFTIIARVKNNLNIHAPITSLILLFANFSKKTKQNIETVKNQEQSEKFTFKK